MQKTVLPPFHDHHTHISFYASLSGTADLTHCSDRSEAMDVLIQYAKKKENDGIIFARGWKNNLYDFDMQELEPIAPIAISNISLHCFRINKKAKDIFLKKNDFVARKLDDQDWIEHNLSSVFALMAEYGDLNLIHSFVRDMESIGIIEMEDMAVCSPEIAEYMAKTFPGRIKSWAELGAYENFIKNSMKPIASIYGIKMFADGALGACTAALSEPCRGGNPRCLLHSDDWMCSALEKAASLKPAIAIHAIGDCAIGQVLQCCSDVFGIPVRKGENGFPKIRIEHAQMITLEQAMLAKKMGITLSMQPNFSMDSSDYADRLPLDYLKANNPFRMLIEKAGFIPGKDLVFGSDGMPHGAEFALQCSVNPPFQSQTLTQDELVKGYECKIGN